MALPCVCPHAGCLSAPALLAYIAVMMLVYLPQMPSCWQSAFGTLLKLMLHLLLWPRTLQQALLFTGNVKKYLVLNQYQCKLCMVASSMLPAHGLQRNVQVPSLGSLTVLVFTDCLRAWLHARSQQASRSLSMTLQKSCMCSKSMWRTRSTCP